ncbi:hypothetical protein J2795_002726 [Chryseobacterium bernardetii]|uniref:Uncharacterized protein n=2 Tax=Chryseobacterium TaxID=59732 RepID=A0A543EBG9_9FLAO|nr:MULTISPECIES: hypothetical protein [Chryseobacterium]MDR6371487.1 hypothetical protein [Chryseobacterium vietnamense]MDR6442008.1 hypothetical protein [Chryseobacterium bernardetii]TQM18886.1 hypothetical protein FB551_3279 [Chryseobacterium aquifrigidense]
MKKTIIHSVPVVISFIWLMAVPQTFNPIILKGHDFLKFYLILVLGFYASLFIQNFLKETSSGATLYFAGFIFLLGIIKLIRGVMLGKPVGFLVMILIAECIVTLVFISNHVNEKIK